MIWECILELSTRQSAMQILPRRFVKSPQKPNPNLAQLSTVHLAMTTSALYAATVGPASCSGAVPEETNAKRHHSKDGKGFINPWDSWHEMSGPAIGANMAYRAITGRANKPDTTPPTVPVRQASFLPTRQTTTLRATWLGHACYFVEFPSGLRILFDPVFSERCSPFSWLGPKRYTRAPCRIEDIPMIDAVVISHNHYDHLSLPTVLQIKDRHPEVHFFCPLGNKEWFTDSGIFRVTELDWWDERDITLVPASRARSTSTADAHSLQSRDASPASITARIGCLPCQHTSARKGWDKGATLWSSWSIESSGRKVWFGGDTGYRAVPEMPEGTDDYDVELPHCPAFKDIGDLRGPFDLGLIPIGAYAPRMIMSPMHANPFDSVNIFKDTRCNRAMGIHWGTWLLTEENVLEPPEVLKKALTSHGIPAEGVFDICDIGESREFG